MSDLTWTNETRRLGDLKPQEDNPRLIRERQAERLNESWDEYGQVDLLAVAPNGEIYNGHQRYYILLDRHGPDHPVECRVASRPLERREWQRLTVLLHEGAVGEWDFDGLANWEGVDFDDLVDWGFEPEKLGVFMEPEADPQEEARKTLAERFIVPPFSVLDARQGYWQERKRAWLALGIKGELGRGEGLPNRETTLGAIPPNQATILSPGYRRGLARCYGQDLMRGENLKFGRAQSLPPKKNGELIIDAYRGRSGSHSETTSESGISIFDPVLCEVAYRWFCPDGGHVINPTAGESVYGIVAAWLGYEYTGVELRPEQVASNEEQAQYIGVDPKWIIGDGRNTKDLIADDADFIMCCPPYYDLEIYSDDPHDLSNIETYEEFLVDYRAIVQSSLAVLKQDRFACFVVGDIRDRHGHYRNFVSDTIAAFRDAGAHLYNEIILINVHGSLPIRVGRQFMLGRKVGKTHQNVLIFVKGDWKRATEVCGEVIVGDAPD